MIPGWWVQDEEVEYYDTEDDYFFNELKFDPNVDFSKILKKHYLGLEILNHQLSKNKTKMASGDKGAELSAFSKAGVTRSMKYKIPFFWSKCP